jgi:hypothetical protein
MNLTVIENPEFKKFKSRSGFRNAEFRKLATLYSRGVTGRAVHDMAVDVDFDEGVCTFTYYRGHGRTPYLQFVVRHVGPHSNMYELYLENKGRIAKSGLFDRVYERLEAEITALMPRTD